MIIELLYEEIEDYLRTHQGVELSLSYVSTQTIRMETEVKKMFIKLHIEIDITIDKLAGNDLYLHYSFPSATKDKIVKLILPFLHTTISRKLPMVELLDDCNVIVHIEKINKLEKTLQLLELKNITTTSHNLALTIKIK